MRRPIVLTGGPGAGKSTCGRALAEQRRRCAFIDVDDLRQLVVSGVAAPWDGPEGERQRELGARNAAALVEGFAGAGMDVVVADVLTPRSAALWRVAVPEVRIVRLVLDADAALRRVGGHHRSITDDELRWIFAAEAADPPAADVVLQVAEMGVEEQLEAVGRIWSS